MFDFSEITTLDIVCFCLYTSFGITRVIVKYKMLYKTRFNQFLTYFALAVFMFFECLAYILCTLDAMSKTVYAVYYVFTFLCLFVQPLLFKYKYIDFWFLNEVGYILSISYGAVWVPVRNIFLGDQPLMVHAAVCNFIWMVFGIIIAYIVKRFVQPKINKVPIFLKFAAMVFAFANSAFGLYAVFKDYITNSNSTVDTFAVIFGLLLLGSWIIIFKIMYDRTEMTKLKAAMAYEEEKIGYYEEIGKKSSEIRRLSHDINNHLRTMQVLAQTSDQKESYDYISDLLNKYDKSSNRFCENRIVDALLLHKFALAEDKKIKVRFETHIPEGISIDSTDLVSIFSNLLDNAIEACKRNSTEENEITLTANIEKSAFNIVCSNTFDQEIKKSGGKILTSKNDKTNHGLGMDIIKNIVSNLGGAFTYKNENSIFTAVVYITL